MSKVINERNLHRNPYLFKSKRPTYVFGELLPQLPADITNCGELTRDEAQMAEAVAIFADIAHETIMDGLEALGNLIKTAGAENANSMPELGRLISYLSVEAQFMLERGPYYHDAAMQHPNPI